MARTKGGGGLGGDFECDGGLVAKCVTTREGSRMDPTIETYITHSLRGEGFDASEDGTGRGTPIIPILAPTLDGRCGRSGASNFATSGGLMAFDCKASGSHGFGVGDIAPTIRSMSGEKDNGGGQIAVAAFKAGQGSKAGGIAYDESLAPTLGAANSGTNQAPSLMEGMSVRRLTPRECERLMGLPDDYTLVPLPLKKRQTRVRYMSDSARYKMIGNSFVRQKLFWLGERIEMVDKLKTEIENGKI